MLVYYYEKQYTITAKFQKDDIQYKGRKNIGEKFKELSILQNFKTPIPLTTISQQISMNVLCGDIAVFEFAHIFLLLKCCSFETSQRHIVLIFRFISENENDHAITCI